MCLQFLLKCFLIKTMKEWLINLWNLSKMLCYSLSFTKCHRPIVPKKNPRLKISLCFMLSKLRSFSDPPLWLLFIKNYFGWTKKIWKLIAFFSLEVQWVHKMFWIIKKKKLYYKMWIFWNNDSNVMSHAEQNKLIIIAM